MCRFLRRKRSGDPRLDGFKIPTRRYTPPSISVKMSGRGVYLRGIKLMFFSWGDGAREQFSVLSDRGAKIKDFLGKIKSNPLWGTTVSDGGGPPTE